ncbi:uncharacterized protein V6R79_014852 [Siganus canaliculatus]
MGPLSWDQPSEKRREEVLQVLHFSDGEKALTAETKSRGQFNVSEAKRQMDGEKTAVEVTSQMPFKQTNCHCHTPEPSLSTSMTERGPESEVERV